LDPCDWIRWQTQAAVEDICGRSRQKAANMRSAAVWTLTEPVFGKFKRRTRGILWAGSELA
jgi:hypothetical protein